MKWTQHQKAQFDVMRAVAKELSGKPMVLKGGTALLFCYGLNRFSEDLDYDCPTRHNLAASIRKALATIDKNVKIEVVKAGENVTRYRIQCETPHGAVKLKIETSHRDKADPKETTIIDGIKVYKIEALVRMKINALEKRTTARDLFDVHFLVSKHPAAFTPETKKRLLKLVANPDEIVGRFKTAFATDTLLSHIDVETLAIELSDAAKAWGK